MIIAQKTATESVFAIPEIAIKITNKMIVSKDINPERDFYYLGAKVIEIIDSIKSSKIDFFEVFEQLNTSEKVSINLFTLTLDWLYIIGAINKSSNGSIIKCF